MRWALLLLLLGLTADAARPDRLSAYPRLDRRDRLGGGKSGPLLSMALTASGASECDGSTPSGLTFTRASSATCTRANGAVVHLAANQPRVTERGLLVEGAATNLVLHSSDLSQAAWTKTAGVTCTKTAVGPDGVANSATRCITTSTAGATVTQTLTTAAATRATSLHLRSTTTCAPEVTRDGTTYTAVPSIPSAWRVHAPSCLSGDSRCVAVPALSSGVANPVIGLRFPANCTVDVALVQDEAGAFATSPIVTAGTSVTRAAEVATVPNPRTGAGSWCWGVTGQPNGNWNSATQRILASTATHGTAGYQYLSLEPPGSGFNLNYGGSAGDYKSTRTASSTLPADSGAHRVVGAYDASGAGAIWLDGIALATTQVGAAAPSDTVLSPVRIGAYTSGTLPFNGHLSNLVIHNTTGGCQ